MADKRLGADFEGGVSVKSGFNNQWCSKSQENNAVWRREQWITQTGTHYYNCGETSRWG